MHGFLSYLIKCNVAGRTYKVFGYGGKQVRDNIHSFDVANFIHNFYEHPRCGEVYNIGGGRANSCSILEAFDRSAALSGKKMSYDYVDKKPRGRPHLLHQRPEQDARALPELGPDQIARRYFLGDLRGVGGESGVKRV